MVKIRCCIKCKKRDEKSNFFRIVPDSNKKAILDENQKISARAIYVCKNKECLQTYIKIIQKQKANIKIEVENESLIQLLESLIVRTEE